MRTRHPLYFPSPLMPLCATKLWHTVTFLVTLHFVDIPSGVKTVSIKVLQPLSSYTFLHFEKRMLVWVSQKRGDGAPGLPPWGTPLTVPWSKEEWLQVSLHSKVDTRVHLKRSQPRALTGNCSQQPGVVKCLGWLNPTTLAATQMCIFQMSLMLPSLHVTSWVCVAHVEATNPDSSQTPESERKRAWEKQN